MNTSDSDLEKYLKMLTLIETEKIDELVKNHFKSPEKRVGQTELAFRVVEIIHGNDSALTAEAITDFMFNKDNNKLKTLENLDDNEILEFRNAM
jgi:tyrosyl-tRNA synthetase